MWFKWLPCLPRQNNILDMLLGTSPLAFVLCSYIYIRIYIYIYVRVIERSEKAWKAAAVHHSNNHLLQLWGTHVSKVLGTHAQTYKNWTIKILGILCLVWQVTLCVAAFEWSSILLCNSGPHYWWWVCGMNNVCILGTVGFTGTHRWSDTNVWSTTAPVASVCIGHKCQLIRNVSFLTCLRR